MPIYIFERNAKNKMAEVEGEQWLEDQKSFGACSFEAFHQEWQQKIAFNEKLMREGINQHIRVDGNPAIYGLWGYNRYYVSYSGEIFFSARLSIESDIEKAQNAGFTIFY